MKRFFRKCLEVALIRLAARILMGRNFARAAVVSRKDNNEMWYMAERLESIANRMSDEYKTVKTDNGEYRP